MIRCGVTSQQEAFHRDPMGEELVMLNGRAMRRGAQRARTTSRCYSNYFRQMLSLCVIDDAPASR
jgi:hypothetical protein